MNSLGIRRMDFVTIYSKNLIASKAFYLDTLGFSLIREVPNEFFQIDVAGVPVCIDLNEREGQQNTIGLEVDDLAATTNALRNKDLDVHASSNPGSNEEWVGVTDPDGNEVIFLIRKRAGKDAE